MQIKKCTKCNIEYTIDNFYKTKNGKYGVRAMCKNCSEIVRKEYRLKNLKLCAKQAKNYRLNNKEHYKTLDKNYRDYYHKSIKGYASKLFSGAKHRAKKKNIDFDITSEWVYNKLEPLICEVTGFALDIKKGGISKTHPLQPTLDRINNCEGYTTKNTRVTCWWYNVMKQDWDDEQIKILITTFYKNKLENG
jgi:hypothetical protein